MESEEERRITIDSRASVAVVILNYNGERHLRRFLPSVVKHSAHIADIIVADNGSCDGSCEVLQSEFSQSVQLIRLDKNYGFAEGYNRALRMVNHDIVILLNSDVEASEGWIEPLIATLERHPEAAIVGSKIRAVESPAMFEYAGAAGGYIDYLGYPFCRGRMLNSVERDEGQYDDGRELFWVSGAAMACRRELFEAVGGFDGDLFAHMEEIDLCWRLQLMGYTIRIEPRSVIYHLGGGTLSIDSPRKTMLNHRNNLAMLFKCAPTAQRITVAILRPALDLLAALTYLLQGRWRSAIAVGEAWCEFIMWHGALAKKRRAIRSSVVADSTYIYKGSILLRRVLGKTSLPL